MPTFDLSSGFGQRKAAEFIAKATDAGWTVQIGKQRTPRSLSQNRFYFSLLAYYGCEVGSTADEMHVDMKREYGLVYEKNGRKYLRSTRELDKKEMSDYIEFIRNHAGQNGIYLPTADEMRQNWAAIQAHIDQHKQWTGEQG